MNADEEIKIVARIQKLLELGAKNPSQAEAKSAMAKAQQLMEQYNISNAKVERASGVASGAREKARTTGGFYEWQRELWKSVAKLNFCLYWTATTWVPSTNRTKKLYGTDEMRKKMHMVVGRIVNTTATKNMAEYLEQVIDRIVEETLTGDPDPMVRMEKLNGSYAHAFRVGMAEELMDKISKRYHSKLAKEQLAAERAKREAKRAAAAGHSTSTSMTLSDYVKSEKDANMDFIYGEGYTARQAAEDAEAARIAKEEEDAYTRWAIENPEEARKQAEDARKRERRQAGRQRYSYSSPRDKLDYGAYNRGRKAAEKVSIDPQVDKQKPVARLR